MLMSNSPFCCFVSVVISSAVLCPSPGPTVEQQTEMARNSGRTLAALHPDQVRHSYTVI